MFVTFRMYGSLPPGRHFPGGRRSAGEEFLELDRLLDREGRGPLYLRMLEIAGVVAHAISQGAEREYALHAWVVMPNHVHLLMTPNVSLPGIMKRLKGTTAREANRRLGREGTPFWQHESYDRLVRDAREFGNIERYILFCRIRCGPGSLLRPRNLDGRVPGFRRPGRTEVRRQCGASFSLRGTSVPPRAEFGWAVRLEAPRRMENYPSRRQGGGVD